MNYPNLPDTATVAEFLLLCLVWGIIVTIAMQATT